MTAKVEERDRRIKLLERIIHYDTQIFTKVKYAIRYDKMATKMNDAEQKRSSHKQNKVLEPYYISSKDYEIEYFKSTEQQQAALLGGRTTSNYSTSFKRNVEVLSYCVSPLARRMGRIS